MVSCINCDNIIEKPFQIKSDEAYFKCKCGTWFTMPVWRVNSKTVMPSVVKVRSEDSEVDVDLSFEERKKKRIRIIEA